MAERANEVSRGLAAVVMAFAAIAQVAVVPSAANAHPPAAVDEQGTTSGTWYDEPLYRSFVLGSPRRPVGGVKQAGVVEFRRGDERWVLSSSMLGVAEQRNGHFGASTHDAIIGDAPCEALVVGMPGANQGRGAVVLLPDCGYGIDPSTAVWLPVDSLGLRPGDNLGSAARIVRRHNGSATFILAGMPGRDTPEARNAGALAAWRLTWAPGLPSDSGAPSSTSQIAQPVAFMQGSGGVLGSADRGDHFGSVLSIGYVPDGFQVAVGVPDEDIGTKRNAGAVALLRFDDEGLVDNALIWQGNGLPGASRSGDRLGQALAGGGGPSGPYAIGIPGKNADGKKNSGAVLVADAVDDWWRVGGYQVITQDTPGVPGKSEKGDRFGSALASLVGTRYQEQRSVAVGSPGEDAKGHKNAGAVTYIDILDEETPPRYAFGHESVRGLAAGDQFGSSFAISRGEPDMEEDYADDVAIGAPGEDRPHARNAGRYYGRRNGGNGVMILANGTSRNERFGR